MKKKNGKMKKDSGKKLIKTEGKTFGLLVNGNKDKY